MGNENSCRVVDLNAVIREVGKLLRSVAGNRLVLRTKLDPKLGRIKADPAKIDWLFLKLAMHAQQSLPAGGELSIATANVELAGAQAIEMGVAPGAYVQIELAAGCKMYSQAKIHEMVQQVHGAITVRNILPLNTRITIVLPRLAEAVPVRAPAVPAPGAAAVVLVVDNEAGERARIGNVLASAGYSVLEAAHGKEAVAALSAFRVDLMITDIVMPEQDGFETIKWARKNQPGLKIVAVSRVPQGFHLQVARLLGAHSAMGKPLPADVLLTTVRDQLK